MKKIAFLLFSCIMIGCGDDGGSAPVGDSCAEDGDCESGLCMTGYGDGVEIAGGTCTTECEWNPDHTDTCPEGQTCLNYTFTGEKNCYVDCVTDADCRTDDGWSCSFLLRACIPPL